MEFVVSMTFRVEELREIWRLWHAHGDGRDPFARTIFTPLFARASVLQFMEQHFRGRSGVIFDSGGYYVQQGVIAYEALYQKLLTFYQRNQWASWYVLPDYVPTSSLSAAEVERRVQATITVTKNLFFTQMPDALRGRALPVVQGHTREQVRDCIESYADLGVSYVGFGSFGTSGENNNINTISRQSIRMIEFLKELAAKHQMRVHLFGIGTPNVLPLFHELGIDSFDSSCWSRTAGYGNVYLPFLGRKSMSGRMLREVGGEAYKRAKFAELKDATGHDCPYCRDLELLKTHRIYQMMHNLYVMLDTVDALNAGEVFVPELVGVKESRYQNYRARPARK